MYGRPWLVLTELFGNLATFLAYALIPLSIEVVRRRREVPFNRLAILFSLFILSCGIGHLFDVFAVFLGTTWMYWIGALNDCLTGIVSLATAYYMFRLIPLLSSQIDPWEHEFLKRKLALMNETKFWMDFTVE